MRPGEFEWIEELARRFGSGDRGGGLVGIGDDAAVIPCAALGAEDDSLVISVDAQVEGIHFQRDWIGFRDRARRLVNVGFSDIAAMGAAPLYALVSVEVGPEIVHDDLAAFTAGMQSGLGKLGAGLIGGNVSSRAAGFSAHITAIGRQGRRAILHRAGARAGEGVYVAGYVGSAAAAIRALSAGGDRARAIPPSLLEAYRNPRAQIREGLLLADSGWASSAIDVSDGLVADLGHICKASGTGAVVDLDRIPVSDDLQAWMKDEAGAIEALALTGGEDYVLLFTAADDATKEADAARRFAELGSRFWRIGTITAQLELRGQRSGRIMPLPTRGFDHLRGPAS